MKSKARSINWANQKYEHMKGYGTGIKRGGGDSKHKEGWIVFVTIVW